MSQVSTRPVTAENWEEALALSVSPEQERFVPSVVLTLAKCFIRPDGQTHEPYAVYAGAAMVGFYRLSYVPSEETKCYLGGFLIDRAYQGRGYGRAALSLYLAEVRRRFPACREVYLTVHPENERAAALYSSAGFEPLAFRVDDEDAMRLTFARADG